jgi:hypothetical protein
MSLAPRSIPRADKHGCAFAGSQLQTQIYVNRRRPELRRAILDGLPALAADEPSFQWVSPLEACRFREYRDYDFLKALGLGRLRAELEEFWPARGPCWDALAVIDRPGRKPGALLVEAKSYPGEIRGGGTRGQGDSRKKIVRALALTQRWLGLPEDGEAWTGELYQTANRLAHLYFLRRSRIDAWLVNVLIVGDRRSPTTRPAWNRALPSVDLDLGLPSARNRSALSFCGKAYLPGRDRSELAG